MANDKKLPGVYANKINKRIKNNEKVNYSKNSEKFPEKTNIKKDKGTPVLQKVNNIFNSPKYDYKAKVEIETAEGKKEKQIIGKNSKYIITYDGELIPIDSIIDIVQIDE